MTPQVVVASKTNGFWKYFLVFFSKNLVEKNFSKSQVSPQNLADQNLSVSEKCRFYDFFLQILESEKFLKV